jgi:hypothetical protein
MKLSRGVARFNKRVTNRIQGLYAWLARSTVGGHPPPR